MLATNEESKTIFTTVPINVEGAELVSEKELLNILNEHRNAEVYILWPEQKKLIKKISSHATVYALGDKTDREALKEAIRSGVEDLLERDKYLVESEDDDEKDEVIHLAPRKSTAPIMQDRKRTNAQIPDLPPVMETEIMGEQTINYARLGELHIQPLGGRQMFCVTSTKGGVGKTTVALNLARMLYESGKGRVIIADLMHPHGNVSTRLLMQSEVNVKTWEWYMNRGVTLTDRVILEELVVKHPNGLYVLPSVNVGEKCSKELVSFILTNIARVFDFVVVDIGVEEQEHLLTTMTIANKTFIVVDYDLATIKDVQDYVKTWYHKKIMLEKVNIIVNFEPTKKDRNSLTREKVKKYLSGLDIVAFLPEVGNMRAIHNEGKLIVQKDINNPFSKAMEKLVSGLIPDFQRNKKGFLQRLFGGKKR